MRDTSRRGWKAWRIQLAHGPVSAVFAQPYTRSRLPAFAGTTIFNESSPPPAAAEKPGPDGIRQGLVARVRAAIEAGEYDTEERWRVAEERLLARIEMR